MLLLLRGLLLVLLVWGVAGVDVEGVGVVVLVVWMSRILELEGCLGVRMRRLRHGWIVGSER